MKRSILLLAALLVFPIAVLAAGHKVVPVDWKLSGSIMDIGVDADGNELKRFDVMLKGDPGKATANGVGFGEDPVPYDELPLGNQCYDIDPIEVAPGVFMDWDGVPAGVFQMTVQFNDGSMLFANAAEGGYICFAPSIAVVTYEIAGGAGRYEDAVGLLDVYIELHRFGDPSVVTAEIGTITGEIILP